MLFFQTAPLILAYPQFAMTVGLCFLFLVFPVLSKRNLDFSTPLLTPC